MAKDFVAMLVGMFLGALIAHAAGSWWFIGLLIGGLMGYGTRMILEPTRCKDAFQTAWRHTIQWRPKHDWKLRVQEGLYFTLALGGIIGTLCVWSLLILFALVLDYKSLLGLVRSYTILIPAIHVGIFLGVIFATYAIPTPSTAESVKKMAALAKRWNIFAIHFYILYLIGKHRRVIASFFKKFFAIVHCDDFTACGMYASLGGAIIFVTTPYQPLLVFGSTILGAAIGACMRRIIVTYAFLEPRTT